MSKEVEKRIPQEGATYVAPFLEFPEQIPDFYSEQLKDEPQFDAHKHLALPLKKPSKMWTLGDLGYSEEEISATPSKIAVTGAFQLLSEEGVQELRKVCLNLYKYHQTHVRTADFVRGAVYRSKFLRDLCTDSTVTEFLSELAGTPLAPHTMPLQLGHINYAPKTPGTTIDKWHTDTVDFVYVVLLSDPSTFEGGKFQFYKGVASEARSLAEKNQNNLPDESVESPVFPKAGWAVFQQGSRVCHRAQGLTHVGERITMVNSYVSRDVRYPDSCRIVDLKGKYEMGYDPQDVLFGEWGRHKAWRAKSRLNMLIHSAGSMGVDSLREELNHAMKELQVALADLSDSRETLLHFGN